MSSVNTLVRWITQWTCIILFQAPPPHPVFWKGEIEFPIKFPELNSSITMGELQSNINSLKYNKACGVDLWPNELIKTCAVIKNQLLVIFNRVLDSGVFPEWWCLGIVKPLHKKGTKHDPNNYRGITLISVIGNLFTRVLNTRLMSWAENNSIYMRARQVLDRTTVLWIIF